MLCKQVRHKFVDLLLVEMLSPASNEQESQQFCWLLDDGNQNHPRVLLAVGSVGIKIFQLPQLNLQIVINSTLLEHVFMLRKQNNIALYYNFFFQIIEVE